MTDLQIIDSLCTVIAQQSALIRELVFELRQLDAVSDEVAEKLYALDTTYDAAVGESKS